MRRYHFDFFGPHAERTARHHAAHVAEWLAAHAIVPLELTDGSAGAGHHGVVLAVEEEHEPAVQRALRPRRVTED